MTEKKHDAVIQNLEDAGCSQETISCFMDCFKEGKCDQELKVLAEHRKCLLDDLHKSQKRIDCLDYLVYQIEKENKR